MEPSRTIAIFSAQYLPHMGGVEVFTYELARRLALQGHRVVVVASEEAGCEEYERVLADEVSGASFEVFRLPSFGLLGGRLPVPKFGAKRRRLLKRLASIPFDGVLVNTRFYPHSLTGARFGARCDIPVAVLDHGADYVTLGNAALDPLVRAYEQAMTYLIRRANPRFYGISAGSCRWLRRLGVEPSGVITNAIDAQAFRAASSGRSFRQEFAIASETLMVVYTGRLIPEKGVREIVEAANLLLSQGANVCFVLAGEGPLEEEMADTTVSLAGRLDSADVSALLQEADAFVFPSRSEGFGSSLLEAAVCGNALVTTPVGIAPDLIPDATYGTLLSATSADVVAAAIGEIAQNREKAIAQAEAVQNRAEHLYDWGASTCAVLTALTA